MFILLIYNSFETEGHCRDQGEFYLLKTIISFNSGKIKINNPYNYYHITMKNLSVPSEMQKCNRIVFVKKIMSLERIFWCTNYCPYF